NRYAPTRRERTGTASLVRKEPWMHRGRLLIPRTARRSEERVQAASRAAFVAILRYFKQRYWRLVRTSFFAVHPAIREADMTKAGKGSPTGAGRKGKAPIGSLAISLITARPKRTMSRGSERYR